MKLLHRLFIPTVIILVPICIGMIIYRFLVAPVIISDSGISIDQSESHLSNDRQYNASVWMGAYNNKLFFTPHRKEGSKITTYQDWICQFDNGEICKLFRLKDYAKEIPTILAELNGNIIYVLHDPFSVCCLNLDTNANRVLYSDQDPGLILLSHVVINENDLLCPLPLKRQTEPTFLHVGNGGEIEISKEICGYELGDAEYIVYRGYDDQAERIICRKDGNSQELTLGGAERRSLIPTDYGILIHNEGGEDILYIIKQDGTVTKLFYANCLYSVTAVAVHREHVYLSLRRYLEYGPMEIGFKRSENDEMEGLYRINLLDGNIVKISDLFFDGLYIFDDTGIFACDEYCSIFKLGFDGEVIDTLLEVKH